MSASTRDIFGAAEGAQPATPGSYGEAPRGYRLPGATRLGRVRLQVSDVARSLAFYEGTLGFRVLRRDGSRVWLAAHGDDAPLVELTKQRGARSVPQRGRLGLYDFAIRRGGLVPHRRYPRVARAGH